MGVLRVYQPIANVYAYTRLPMTDQGTAYNWYGKRLSYSYLDSYESSKIEEKIDDVDDSRPMLIDTELIMDDKGVSS